MRETINRRPNALNKQHALSAAAWLLLLLLLAASFVRMVPPRSLSLALAEKPATVGSEPAPAQKQPSLGDAPRTPRAHADWLAQAARRSVAVISRRRHWPLIKRQHCQQQQQQQHCFVRPFPAGCNQSGIAIWPVLSCYLC